jgi:hypothetical protein
MFKTLIAVAALAATTGAMAAPSHMSDAQYLSAVRCQALMSSPALGKGDTAGIDQVLKAESGGRVDAISDRADEVRATALRQASHAGATGRAALIAERNDSCQAWASNAGPGMASTPSQPAGAN